MGTKWYNMFFVLFFLASILNPLYAQSLNDYLKPKLNIRKYYLNKSELRYLYENGVISMSKEEQKRIGLIEFKGFTYNFKDAEKYSGTRLEFIIMVFKSKESLNEIFNPNGKVLIPFFSHKFFLGDNVLVFFDVPEKLGSKTAYMYYFKVLDSYRKRTGAKLLINPSDDFNEKEYFEAWAEAAEALKYK